MKLKASISSDQEMVDSHEWIQTSGNYFKCKNCNTNIFRSFIKDDHFIIGTHHALFCDEILLKSIIE